MNSDGKQLNVKEEDKQRLHLSKLKAGNIIYPVLIGLAVVGYMIWKEFDIESISQLDFTLKTVFWLFIALLCMVGRDVGYIIRLKILSSGALTWRKAFNVIMLWEFTSAVTPSAIGGTSFAVIYVHKEGLSVGRSSAIVLLTSFLDELYFIIMFPLLFLILGKSQLFGLHNIADGALESGIITIALVGYFIKLAYTMLISYGLFINPKGFKWLLFKIFQLPFLRKYIRSAVIVGNDIGKGAEEVKNRDFKFWSKAILSTFLSWSSRYLVVNAILIAFFTYSDQLLLFARQLVMWIMMLIMPTPGGSGFAEYLFKEYLGEFIPNISLAVVMALIWRLITYYPYLVVGAIMLPRWIKSKFGD